MTAPDRDGGPGSEHAAAVGTGRVLRRVREAEAEAYRELVQEAYRADLAVGVRFGASGATREDVIAHLRRNLALALVDPAFPEQILATVSIRFPWGPNPGPLDLPHLGWLAADPGRPEQGLGGEVLARVEREVLAEELHAPAVTLGTAQEHPWLGAYYQRRGYRFIGTRDLGLGHLTDYYLRPLDPSGHDAWSAAHRAQLEGLLR